MKPCGAIVSSPYPCKSDFKASETFAGAAPLQIRDYDVRDVHDWRIQGAPQCVLYSLTAQISILAAKQNSPLPRLGANLAWWGTRNYMNPPGTLITRTSRRIAMKYVRDRGLKLESLFPDEPSNHSRVPDSDILAEPPIVQLAEYHRILGEGDENKLREESLKAFALCERGECSPPNVILAVGSDFDAVPNEGVWDGKYTDVWGGHDLCAVTYSAKYDALGLASTWHDNLITYIPIPILAQIATDFTVITKIQRS